MEQFQKAIDIDPSDVESYLCLGEVYESMGMSTRAHRMYEMALQYDEDNEWALEKLSSKQGAMKRLMGLMKFSRS